MIKKYSILVLAAGLLVGCASTLPIDAPSPEAPAALTDEYHIGVDDVVRISVWRNPELSVTVPVRPDGMISIPLVGDLQAGGKTPTEVSKDIEAKLAFYVREPKVAVILTELRSHEYLTRIRVTGAVETPTSLPFRQGITVLDVVIASGGLNEFADPDKSRLYRRGESKTEVYPIQLKKILNDGDLATNYELQPGDVVTVPERFF